MKAKTSKLLHTNSNEHYKKHHVSVEAVMPNISEQLK